MTIRHKRRHDYNPLTEKSDDMWRILALSVTRFRCLNLRNKFLNKIYDTI